VDAIMGAVADLPSWRVHRFPPANVASPCVYVDIPSLQTIPDAIVAEWPVVLVIDGGGAAQAQAFDQALSSIWDALNTLDYVTVAAAYPGAKDIGGPNQRVYVLTVSSYLVAQTLCHPSLSEAVPTP
jgi:hypothetical protein